MELWDIYDADKKPTGRTMKRNDWCLKDGEYHLTVLGVVARPDQTFLITKRVITDVPDIPPEPASKSVRTVATAEEA